jgi:hypothetical protein
MMVSNWQYLYTYHTFRVTAPFLGVQIVEAWLTVAFIERWNSKEIS